jgi:hypothetical protein
MAGMKTANRLAKLNRKVSEHMVNYTRAARSVGGQDCGSGTHVGTTKLVAGTKCRAAVVAEAKIFALGYVRDRETGALLPVGIHSAPTSREKRAVRAEALDLALDTLRTLPKGERKAWLAAQPGTVQADVQQVVDAAKASSLPVEELPVAPPVPVEHRIQADAMARRLQVAQEARRAQLLALYPTLDASTLEAQVALVTAPVLVAGKV